MLVRVLSAALSFPAWKAGILAGGSYPRIGLVTGSRIRAYAMARRRATVTL